MDTGTDLLKLSVFPSLLHNRKLLQTEEKWDFTLQSNVQETLAVTTKTCSENFQNIYELKTNE